MSTKRVIVFAMLVIGAFFLFSSISSGSEPSPQEAAAQEAAQEAHAAAVAEAKLMKNLRRVNGQANKNKLMAIYWADKRGNHPYPLYHLKLTHDLEFEKWRRSVWSSRASKQYQLYNAYLKMWKHADKNIHFAIKIASKHFGVSYNLLHSCAHSEGLQDAHEPWVMNHGGSGAGGWFQFMESTFYGNLYRTGDFLPKKYRHWNSKAGQAAVAAAMFAQGRSSEWTGAGCN